MKFKAKQKLTILEDKAKFEKKKVNTSKLPNDVKTVLRISKLLPESEDETESSGILF